MKTYRAFKQFDGTYHIKDGNEIVRAHVRGCNVKRILNSLYDQDELRDYKERKRQDKEHKQ